MKAGYPRIDSLKNQLVTMARAGTRRSLREGLIRESLARTKGEPWPIRRAKGFRHILDHAESVFFDGDLIAGSLYGLFPLHERQYSSQEVCEESRDHIRSLLSSGASFGTSRKLLRLQYDYEGPRVTYDHLVAAAKRINEELESEGGPTLEQVVAALQEHFCDAPQTVQLLRAALAKGNLGAANEGDPAWTLAHHIIVDFQGVLEKGFGGIREEALACAEETEDTEAEIFYRSVVIAMEAVGGYARRCARELDERGSAEQDVNRKREIGETAAILAKAGSAPARSFREAVQLVWLTYLMLTMAGGTAIAAGRLDQYLFPYYRDDLQAGRITRDDAFELLACLWLKIGESVNVPAENVTIGGMTAEGGDGVNAITYLVLDVVEYLQVPHPNLSLRVSGGSDSRVFERVVDIVDSGLALPALWNDDLMVEGLENVGIATEDARDYGIMGCIEVVLPGKQPPYENGGGVNLPAILVRTVDEAGDPDRFEDLKRLYLSRIDDYVSAEARTVDARFQDLQRNGCDPFGSALIRGCMASGRDMYRGGSRYPASSGFWCIGLATAADALAAIRELVYREKRMSLSQLAAILRRDFEGEESLRFRLRDRMPKYGNDDDLVDDLAIEISDRVCRAVLSCNDGGSGEIYLPLLGSYVSHISGGACAATADGRRSGDPLSDAASPAQGGDRLGPTAVIRSVTKLDYTKAPGGVGMNIRFHETAIKGTEGRDALIALMRTYLAEGGQQITFNVVGAESLRDAMANPELHQGLVVRVAGFNEYFVRLDPKLQREIASRTAHSLY